MYNNKPDNKSLIAAAVLTAIIIWAGLHTPSAHASPSSPMMGGSAFAVSEDGIFSTAYHVAHIRGKAPMMAVIDDKPYPVEIIADDRAHDLSLVKVFINKKVKVAPLELPQVGETTSQEGYPGYLGFTFAVFSGKIIPLTNSGPDRYYDIKIEGKTCGGQSGGAIVNTRGSTVGYILAGNTIPGTELGKLRCSIIGWGNSSQRILNLMGSHNIKFKSNSSSSTTAILITPI